MNETDILKDQLDEANRCVVIADAIRDSQFATERQQLANEALRRNGMRELLGHERTELHHGATAEYFDKRVAALNGTKYTGQSNIDTLRKESAQLSESRTMLTSILVELGFDPDADMTPAMLPKILSAIRDMKAAKKAASSFPSGGRAYSGRPIHGLHTLR